MNNEIRLTILTFLCFLSTGCYSQQQKTTAKKEEIKIDSIKQLLFGIWTSLDDNNYKLKIDSSTIYEYYENELANKSQYSISIQPNEKQENIYIIQGAKKLEVTNLTKKNLSYMNLTNGRVVVFEK